MEQNFGTMPELAGVLAELTAREPIFHRPEFGITRADFEQMTVDDFWETGASGRRYSRNFILDELERRFSASHDDIWETRDFFAENWRQTFTCSPTRCSRISDGSPGGRPSGSALRTVWKIVYHQGTIVPDAWNRA